jgi:hypothetical protein
VQRVESAAETHLPDAIVDNLRRTIARGKQVYAWAKKHKVPIGFGTLPFGSMHRAGWYRVRELSDGIPNPAPDRYAVVIVGGSELIDPGIAFAFCTSSSCAPFSSAVVMKAARIECAE